MEPLTYIQRICANQDTPDRVAGDLEALSALVKSGEFRDWPFNGELYAGLFRLLALACSWRAKESQPYVLKVQQTFWGMVRAPEFDTVEAQTELDDELLRAVASRTDGSASQDEWPFIRDIFLWLYEKVPNRRPQLRGLISKPLRSASRFMHKSAPLAPMLQVLGPIIRGFATPLGQVQKRLLFDILLPMHKPNDWLQWDRQTPIISMYHKELVHCVHLFLEKDAQLATRCLEAVCSHFPQAHEANTPKDVLLIHEMAEILKFMDAESMKGALPRLLSQMTRLLGSHNTQPVQSVLQFWKDEHVARLLAGVADQLIPTLLPVLLRNGEPFWNPTVNRMTSLVLERLEAANAEVFTASAEQLWGPGRQVPAFEIPAPAPAAAEATGRLGPAPSPPQNLASLKFRANGWTPGAGKQPPATATGVAPWAFKGGGSSGSTAKQPPLTATGVAPWAFNKEREAPIPESCQPAEPKVQEPEAASGLERVHRYMKILCPEVPETETGRPWEAALMAESTTLLPTLKFHQLVFGAEDIGEGAFSVVRYARQIHKEKSQAQWPEYAVKVINTKTMEELGYEASVNREICVLKMLSHPGIARMVAAFRYREGAYLVLEYAARGDLHTLLVSQGKLDEETARFFLGETIAALCAIHEIGFVYADLKPENIVITSNCHAKLTDFGGCRPVTDTARARTRQSLIKRLRDGDWRAPDTPETAPLEDEDSILADDGRVEGTIMYLPPEVVRGGAPSFASDAWALGCLTHQLLSGRPPLWVDSESEAELRSRIVSFSVEDGQAQGFAELSTKAQSLVSALLQRDVPKRMSVSESPKSQFFEGMDVFSLYRKPRGPVLPEVQKKAPGGDERWQRRQFSKIWTVMPSSEDFVPPKSFGVQATATLIAETDGERNAPFSGEGAVGAVPSHRIESL
eukprot:TRINITY_DN73855_c0_g1_i1.p1 TRINITY_DN73855_c0_g1~~TRINITY_DN73855_c0_g1_i1.p1  ORF type:complete len:916 (-),score=147.14 TRINITY_DN73855_c0_g1_i1:58-2805(-)